MAKTTFNVMFLCTGNSARSIIAESVLRRDGAGKFNAYSAGSQPKNKVNPFAIETLAGHHYPVEGLRSKSWDEFAVPGAPELDFVFTVCDNAAGEACPVWPGQPMTAHWGVDDPAAVEGTDAEKRVAFATTLRHMKLRIAAFAALPVESLERLSLTARLHEIGQMEGSTSQRPDVA
ncbi:arsenate reductase ArsC [Sinorhizobium medicae]|uniref:Protein tyrosine phosphatase n=1 Tax=Sinorhizobium medicae TaxID=110321 RepID=A0A508XAG2_9HYPH|nr:arsenate reductase ArsC [Sinorhizobium medicae]MBO1945214.1 arsenate reductase ArsC [Sinorhizobium medicae]MBO1960256.1 arsenate reductase ArsC [Sinorhizobium medicae]MDX0424042.1 arsenate reductase ArsC [Sinorhizobium medicae]MDX0431474.1 arsenate reductase ArsC [Sinorhizobium medicae]MDX0435177.1 arsenate reductase ArsC [Sinorhizobium medicae]